MRDFLLAAFVVVVLLILALWASGSWRPGEGAGQADAGIQYEELPALERPDYASVVTDAQRAAELADDAEEFIDELAVSATEAVVPGLRGKESAADVQLFNSETPLLLESTNTGTALTSIAALFERFDLKADPDKLYYRHEVSGDDNQGVWGIIQIGLIERFADGIAIRRQDDVNTYRVLIPTAADERLATGYSSFLGRVLDHKTREAVVLNLPTGKLKPKNQKLSPGEDLIVVGFEPAELIGIYQYFATGGGKE